MDQQLSLCSDLDKKIRDFATQMAMGVEKTETIRRAFGLTEDQALSWQELEAYKSYYESAKAEWDAAHNTPARAELKAARATEEAIPAIFAHIHNMDATDTSRIEAFKALGKLGRIGERGVNGSGGGGDAIKIVINMGDAIAKFEKDAPVITIEPEKYEAVT